MSAAGRSKSPLFRRRVSFPVTSPPSSPSTLTPPSLKNRVVFLHQWWLIKTDPDSHGRRLGVGGLSSRGSQVQRRFRSAAIVKRDDSVTFHTVDGVTVLVQGYISRPATLGNGFPCKVCEHFQIGFPYDWDKYACMSFDENENPTTSGDSESGNLLQIFDDLMQEIDVAKKESSSSTVPVSPTPVEISRKRNIEMASNDILHPSDGAKKKSSPRVKSVPSTPDVAEKESSSLAVPVSPTPVKNSRKRNIKRASNDIPQPSDGAKNKSVAKCEKQMAHRKTSHDTLQQGDSVEKESYPQVKHVPSAPEETPVKHTKVQARKKIRRDTANTVQPSGRLTRSKTRLLQI